MPAEDGSAPAGSRGSPRIAGLGIDLVELHRLAPLLRRDRFLGKVFSAREIADARRGRGSDARLVWAFAAKEAFMKAIGAGIGQGVWFSDIEIVGGPAGASLRLHGPAAELLTRRGVMPDGVHVSGSCDSRIALAVVILERAEPPASRTAGQPSAGQS